MSTNEYEALKVEVAKLNKEFSFDAEALAVVAAYENGELSGHQAFRLLEYMRGLAEMRISDLDRMVAECCQKRPELREQLQRTSGVKGI